MKYYEYTEKELQQYFYDTYFKKLFEILNKPLEKYNSKQDVINALRSGIISFHDGEFYGSLNIRISRELSKFCTFDKRSKRWKGNPPPDIKAAAIVANEKAKSLQLELFSTFNELKPIRYEGTKGIQKVFKEVDQSAEARIVNLGIIPKMTEKVRENLISEYIENQNINIKNWDSEQIIRLRGAIEKSLLEGVSKPRLIEMIQNEYEVSQNKARFLARQETSLFVSNLENTRYTEAGLQIYQWLTSNDVRVVGTPGGKYPKGSKGHGNHFVMKHKICKLNDPTVYADSIEEAKKGKWKSKREIGADDKHPGESFQCRCRKKPLIL